MIKRNRFKPKWWLRNPHLQTICPTLLSGKNAIQTRAQRLELPDGDFIDLNWIGPKNRPIVILLHGLGGNIQSPYISATLQTIEKLGLQGLLMHFRGCSGIPNRLARSYHSGDTGDLNFLVQWLIKSGFDYPMAIIGYSLGGNVLLKWLGKDAVNNNLKCAIAVSVPFDLGDAAKRINTGFSKFYQWLLLRDLKSNLQKKFKNVPCPIPLKNLNNLSNFWQFDNQVTAPLHGFADVHDYYNQSSSRQYLKTINTNTLIIHAADDPFISPAAIPQNQELGPNTTLELNQHGGHVGFLAHGKAPLAQSWLQQRIQSYLNRSLTRMSYLDTNCTIYKHKRVKI